MKIDRATNFLRFRLRRFIRTGPPLVIYPFYMQQSFPFVRPFLFIKHDTHWSIGMGRSSFSLIRPKDVRDDSAFLFNMLEPYDAHTKIRRGNVVLDAGASIGEQTMMYASLVGKKGRVVSVEPSPKRAAMLRRNVEINKLNNVTVVAGALWSSPGTIELEFYSPDVPGFKISESGTSKETVPTHTIDQLASQLGIKKIDFLKMDIEGSEYEAIKNIATPIKAMGMETHTINEKNTVYPIVKLLRERGYDISVQWRKNGLHILNAILQ